jgi:HAD superfamily hydrolase (TIGR01549 family)
MLKVALHKNFFLSKVLSAFQERSNKLIIFDLDGTLIHSDIVMGEALSQCYQQEYPGETPDFEYFFSMMGDSLHNIFARMNISKDLLDMYREYSRQNIHKITLVSDLLEGIVTAKEHGKYIALYTGKEKDRTIEILKYFNILNLFDYILTSDDVDNTKPHPEGILKVLSYFGINHHQALMIGDSENDIKAAHDANVPSIFVSWQSEKSFSFHNKNSSQLAANGFTKQFSTLLGMTSSPIELQRVLACL